ncbi:biopolymer transporter ExbB [Roseicyclus sp. F158]|uniref:Biopolymer transporter ExbB n=1 Tax=Tropicimonas omnivorans TaxID=3075590 RepID=A0ABU3DFU3_9RHOB|nr:biopolymer transporter ExbB [Roseicyclus sp. F158]MDT0682564.1 biopolymer transporter ExbB [Roseicyclus sp. F158]
MDVTAHGAQKQFSKPVRQVTLMLGVLVLVIAGAWFIYPSVAPIFLSNPFLNGLIAFVFVVGVAACFFQVLQLFFSVGWVERFVGGEVTSEDTAPRLLAPLAQLLYTRGTTRKISATSATSILDSVATRIEEARDITRYLVSLLIFLGLLGTFYGLATTVPAVVETIRSLAPQNGEGGVEVFSRLMSGLEAQLGGMGTAFGSSLLGLAGSLVVGLLELFASHGQNRFYRELEEWLSTITKLGFTSGDGEAADAPTMVGVLEHMADQMESMREMFTQSDISRSMMDERLSDVATSVTALTARLERGDATSEALMRVADGQERLIERLGRTADSEGEDDGGDAESRMRLRSIDLQLVRILEELAAGRQETVADLRSDLAGVTRELRRQAPRGQARTGPAANLRGE